MRRTALFTMASVGALVATSTLAVTTLTSPTAATQGLTNAGLVAAHADAELVHAVPAPAQSGQTLERSLMHFNEIELADNTPDWSLQVREASERPIRAVRPTRIFDSRRLDQFKGGIPAGQSGVLKVAGANGVPLMSLGGVVLNVAAVEAEARGFVRLYPAGSPRIPATSSLNYIPGEVASNLAIVGVNDAGEIAIDNLTKTHLIIDLVGYVKQEGGYMGMEPVRALDSRESLDGGFRGGETRSLQVSSLCNTNGQEVDSVVANITTTEHRDNGYLAAWPADLPRPETSNINYRGHVDRAGMAIIPVSHDGEIKLYTHSEGHIIVDIVGCFAANRGYTGVKPFRIADTRELGRPVGSGEMLRIPVTGGEIPEAGVRSVFVNITSVDSRSNGYVAAHYGGLLKPRTSSLNYNAGNIISNTALAQVWSDGAIRLYNVGDTNLVVDVYGYMSTDPHKPEDADVVPYFPGETHSPPRLPKRAPKGADSITP